MFGLLNGLSVTVLKLKFRNRDLELWELWLIVIKNVISILFILFNLFLEACYK